jgi:hypothetical protein
VATKESPQYRARRLVVYERPPRWKMRRILVDMHSRGGLTPL